MSARDEVHFGLVQEGNDQPVGQAHDLGSAVAEAPVHAVVVRAVGLGDGDGPIFDGDGVAAAAVRFHGELLIHPQINDVDHLAVAGDFGPSRALG